MKRTLLFMSMLVAACGEVREVSLDAATDSPDPAGSTFAVGGVVQGFAGDALVLVLDGQEELAVTSDGAFSFPTRRADGAAYSVEIKSQPVCPIRRCALANATGTIAGADVTTIAITCERPKYRLVSGNWGTPSLRITDDVLALADGAMATPRVVAGPATQIVGTDVDSVAVDAKRDLIYLATSNGIQVYTNASTISGNVPFARRITAGIADERFFGLEIDEENDRLYATAYGGIYVYDLASTLSGAVVPTAKIAVVTDYDLGPIALDRAKDRLYVGTYGGRLYAYDDALALTPRSTPSRVASWTNWQGPSTIAVEECNGRVYLGSNWQSPGGFNMFVFDDASMLDGPVDLEAESTARLRTAGQQAISATIDSDGNLHYWTDSPSSVYVHTAPETFSGATTVMPTKTIHGVVERGYGLAVVPY